jgi:hypothetical protein
MEITISKKTGEIMEHSVIADRFTAIKEERKIILSGEGSIYFDSENDMWRAYADLQNCLLSGQQEAFIINVAKFEKEDEA